MTQTVWVFEDGTVRPIGTAGCCSCGGDSFAVMEFDDAEEGDVEAT